MALGRRAFILVCWAFLVLIPVQFALAGMGVMGGNLEVHMAFGHMVLGMLIPLLLLIFGAVGRVGWALIGFTLLLWVMMQGLMFLPAAGEAANSHLLAGLHPAVAMLTWPYVYFVMLRRARQKAASTSDVTTMPEPVGAPA